MSREDLDRFMTPASRALVDQFTAEASDEDDDVDMDDVVRRNLADHEAALTGKPAESDSGWTALWRRICQVATGQPDVQPDMDPDQFERILKQERRPSTTDLALIADAFGVTVPWLVTGADEDADLVALLRREAKHVRQEMANADPQAGLADLKRRLKPTIGYVRVLPDCDPAKNPTLTWHQVSLPEARQGRELAIKQESKRTIIVKVTTTFEIVEGGSRD